MKIDLAFGDSFFRYLIQGQVYDGVQFCSKGLSDNLSLLFYVLIQSSNCVTAPANAVEDANPLFDSGTIISEIPERAIGSSIEASDASAFVLPSAAFVHHSRTGPDIGCGEGVFQPAHYGEFSIPFRNDRLLPDIFAVSSESIMF